MAARPAFAGSCAAPWRAAAAAVCKPDAVTITWLVPRGEDKVEVVCVVLVSLAPDASEVEAEADGEGLSEGEVTAEEAGGAVEMTVAVLLDVLSVVPEGRTRGERDLRWGVGWGGLSTGTVALFSHTLDSMVTKSSTIQ